MIVNKFLIILSLSSVGLSAQESLYPFNGLHNRLVQPSAPPASSVADVAPVYSRFAKLTTADFTNVPLWSDFDATDAERVAAERRGNTQVRLGSLALGLSSGYVGSRFGASGAASVSLGTGLSAGYYFLRGPSVREYHRTHANRASLAVEEWRSKFVKSAKKVAYLGTVSGATDDTYADRFKVEHATSDLTDPIIVEFEAIRRCALHSKELTAALKQAQETYGDPVEGADLWHHMKYVEPRVQQATAECKELYVGAKEKLSNARARHLHAAAAQEYRAASREQRGANKECSIQ